MCVKTYTHGIVQEWHFLCLAGISSSLPLWCSSSQVLNTRILCPHGLRAGYCYYSNLRTGAKSEKSRKISQLPWEFISLDSNNSETQQHKVTLLTQSALPIRATPSLEELEKCNNVSRTGHIQNRRKILISYCRTS